MLTLLFAGRRRWMTLLVIAGALLCVRLGIWQLDRLAQRRSINASIDTRMAQPPLPLTGAPVDPEALDYRQVEVRGVYDPAQEIVLRNRELDGVPGVHVVTPLLLNGGSPPVDSGPVAAVLVDRGWVPLDRSSPEARRTFDQPGEVVVRGVARRSQESGGPQESPLGPGEARRDAWFRLDIPRIEQQLGYKLLPLFIEAQPAPGDATLPRRTPTVDLGEGPHLGYAFQWFAFAAILLVGYPAFLYQHVRRIQESGVRSQKPEESAS
jgi:surfeit locus 1 family protein